MHAPEAVEVQSVSTGRVSDRPVRSDDEVIRAAKNAANGRKFSRLWAGDSTEYPHEEEADAALCCMLAYWGGPDPERVERLFNLSGLAKGSRWAKRPSYRESTIKAALAKTRDFSPLITRGTRITQVSSRQVISASRRRCEDDRARNPDESREVAWEMAVRLAEGDSPHLPGWQAAFKLARRLRTLSEANPRQFEPAVVAYCEKIGREKEDVWYPFLRCWDKVLLNDGEDALGWAAKESAKSPFVLADSLGETYGKVASLAYYLSQITGKAPFWLPRREIADLLATHPNKISDVVTLLVVNGVLECVDESYSYTKGKAKEYRFLGGSAPTSSPA